MLTIYHNVVLLHSIILLQTLYNEQQWFSCKGNNGTNFQEMYLTELQRIRGVCVPVAWPGCQLMLRMLIPCLRSFTFVTELRKYRKTVQSPQCVILATLQISLWWGYIPRLDILLLSKRSWLEWNNNLSLPKHDSPLINFSYFSSQTAPDHAVQ